MFEMISEIAACCGKLTQEMQECRRQKPLERIDKIRRNISDSGSYVQPYNENCKTLNDRRMNLASFHAISTINSC